jgi:arginyl-tRNA--protein-N-Asp/Glu arginylyltransferase
MPGFGAHNRFSIARPARCCSACKSARIPVAEFKASAAASAGAEAQCRSDPPAASRRRDAGAIAHCSAAISTPATVMATWPGMDFFDFASMVEDGAEHTEIVEYRDAQAPAGRRVLVDRLD